ncbi:polysaccharide biosynthesis tyrosine autokinase [candidate division KSB1 bacterium]|nr:polysaccharide biosynthesis tyrosine autokinase [candidate division KSB1 bacterium]
MEELREQQVSLNDYIRILYRGRWIIVISFLVIVSATAYYTFTTQPVYETAGLVMIKEQGSVQSQLFDMSSFMKKETMINNQVEILKSYTLAEDVIQRLQKSPHADSLWILGKREKEDRFSVKKWLFTLLRLDTMEAEEPTLEDLAENFREYAISVVPKRDTDMIEMHVQAFSPDEASIVTNTWMEGYQDLDISMSRGEVSEVQNFLDDKLQSMQQELTNAEDALKGYKEINQVVELTAETAQLIQQSAEFQTLYQEARTNLEANERRLEYLKSQLDASQRSLIEQATNLSSPAILVMQEQMAELIAEKASYEAQLRGAGMDPKEDYQLKTKDQRLKGLQEKIVEETKNLVARGTGALNPLNVSEQLLTQILEIETENKSYKSRTDEFQKIVVKYDKRLNSLPEKSLKLARLEREAEVNNNIFMMLREKYEENRIAEAGQLGSVRIVDWAKPPKDPIKPRKKMNLLMGMMVGFGLGIGITFLREYLDNSLKTIEDVERMGFPVLGSIPFITSEKVSSNGNGINGDIRRIESRLITHFAPKSPISEAYRTLRTNIQYAKADSPIKSFLVTSSGPGEGKSTTVANLAITFAQMGARTLLVDTDLRRPVLHGIFGQSRNDGLTNILVGRTTLQQALKTTQIEDLFLVTSGTLPPNPSELLTSKMMEQFLNEANEQFDIILLDTPPVIAVTDAAILSRKVDGAVLVLRSGQTVRDIIVRSRAFLEKVNAKLLGVLVNGLQVNNMYGSYYHYYENYYAHDGKDKKKSKGFA